MIDVRLAAPDGLAVGRPVVRDSQGREARAGGKDDPAPAGASRAGRSSSRAASLGRAHLFSSPRWRIDSLGNARGLAAGFVMVNVGVIGLGSVWECRYRPALAKLSQRIRVRAVYDPVAGRAEQVAAELSATPCQGVLALMRNVQVRGVLFLDACWHAPQALELLCRSQKPAFVAGSLGSDPGRIARYRELADAEGLTIMPEFSRRFTPATSRLQELIATKLGKAHKVTIEAAVPDADSPEAVPGQCTVTDFLVGLFDWSRYVLRTTPLSLESVPFPAECSGAAAGRAIHVQFSQSRSGGESPIAEFRLHGPQSEPAASVAGLPTGIRFDIQCERGWARIESADAICWKADAGEVHESLAADRTDVEVMIDHFCRRVAGGLIPVADIADVWHGFRMAEAAEQSLTTGRPVSLSDLV